MFQYSTIFFSIIFILKFFIWLSACLAEFTVSDLFCFQENHFYDVIQDATIWPVGQILFVRVLILKEEN